MKDEWGPVLDSVGDAERRDIAVNLFNEGSVFGELALLSDDPHRTATVVAMQGGTTRSTANRMLQRARELGAIALRRGQVRIIDAEAIRARAR